jgi:hypothetical protein
VIVGAASTAEAREQLLQAAIWKSRKALQNDCAA